MGQWETFQIDGVGRFLEPLMVALNSQEILIIGDDDNEAYEGWEEYDMTIVFNPEENIQEELCP